ncbi:hypothetical protein TSUD_127490 [Trifolium subterraneum]|nr:hypothetical protein TSUD_127490 [Trifolium subterraneum]
MEKEPGAVDIPPSQFTNKIFRSIRKDLNKSHPCDLMHNLKLQADELAIEDVNYLIFIRVAVTFEPQPQELLKKHKINRRKKLYTCNIHSMED